MQVEVLPDLGQIEAADWDRIAGADDPFCEHAFLRALETSGSVGGDSGWVPLHVTVRDAGQLVGAMPMYLKLHSYGEYIFDWTWASASERAGLPYYPKLVAMAPFTPATGTRLLVDPAADRARVIQALLHGAMAAADEMKASSVHLLFLNPDEQAAVQSVGGFMPRLSSQFHWHNEGYKSFDEYLDRFRSSMRKQVRRERKRANGAGLRIQVKEGPDLGDADWSALRDFYLDTCHKRGSGPYLKGSFFSHIREAQASAVVAVLAYDGDRPVAGTLNFQKGKHLYGRYWGCLQDYDMLHFELCYYRLIERAIEHGLTRFEAGAQGTHKLRRGLMPAAIHSAHWIRHPGLNHAIAEYLPREADAVRAELADLSQHGPFKRGGD